MHEMATAKQNIAKCGQSLSSVRKTFFKNQVSSGRIWVLIFKSAPASIFFFKKKNRVIGILRVIVSQLTVYNKLMAE